MPTVIRSGLNAGLVASVQLAAIALLWLGERSGAALPVVGIVFSFLLLTNYALLHEATHGNLNADPDWNQHLGQLCGCLFPIPFSMIKVTHTVHHCCNRTDHEMFDLYYPGDSRFLKLGQWYGLMSGFFWPCIPIGAAILAVFPGLLKTRPFRKARTTAVLFDDFEAHGIARIRRELAFVIAYWVMLIALLGLGWQSLLVLYACFAFNWSTRQYVTHAFTQRDVVNGALNLRVSRPMAWLLLQGNWDLVHHQRPWLPWTELAGEGRHSAPPVGFWGQYVRMWAGPIANTEPAPMRLPATPDAAA